MKKEGLWRQLLDFGTLLLIAVLLGVGLWVASGAEQGSRPIPAPF